jgi:hypothetical protein
MRADAQVQDETKIALSGFSLSESFRIEDRQAFDIRSHNLLRLVYRLWQTSFSNLEQYSRFTGDVDWQRILDDPAGYRLQVFSIEGHVRSVVRIPLPEADQEPRHVYRCRGISVEGKPFEVLSLHAPAVWLRAEELAEPIKVLGFFFGTIEPADSNREEPLRQTGDDGDYVPLFVAKRLFWYPAEVRAAFAVTPSHVELARHGVDISGFDFVRREDRQPLGDKDARTFYQILNAVARVGTDFGDEGIDHMELLRNPTANYGRRVSFRARVRQCSIIRPEADSPLDGELYYQLIVFPDLRDSRGESTTVEIGKGEEKLSYRRFPFTVCVGQLPEGLTPEQIENQQVWIDGFYFRFWRFDAERTRDTAVGAQISPLIIANMPQMIPSTMGELENFFSYLLLLVAGILAIVGLTIFRAVKRQSRTKLSLPDRIEIDELEKAAEPRDSRFR